MVITVQFIFLRCYSGSSYSESNSESESSNSVRKTPNVSYRQIIDSYEEIQSKLEPHHTYKWKKRQKKHEKKFTNEYLLSDSMKKHLRSLSQVT